MKTFHLPPRTDLLPRRPEFLSPETLHFHYEKHYGGYIEKTNRLLTESPLASATLEEVIKKGSGELYDNAAQTWNHTFYWLGLSGKDSTFPENCPNLKYAAECSVGSLEDLLEEFHDAALHFFGSGWVWLVKDLESDQIQVVSCQNAGNPLRDGFRPLLVCDVWEHAYYLDHQNNRAEYLKGFMRHINWDFVEQNLKFSTTRPMTPYLQKNEFPLESDLKIDSSFQKRIERPATISP